ncbi:MAG: hypothetical protein GY940_09910, partial [bacterium]|nr:hypothetical protein [bacterium]
QDHKPGENYTGHLPTTPGISGKVALEDGTGIPDVTLTFSNGGGTTVTNTNGKYSRAVKYGWSGTVIPSKTGYTFNPLKKIYTNVTEGKADQDYTGKPTTPPVISGKIATIDDRVIPGVTLTFEASDGTKETEIADTEGHYTHTVDYGWSGTVTPSKRGYTFEPLKKTYTNVTQDRTQDYIGKANTPFISGEVTTGDTGISGVTLTFKGNDGVSKTTLTDATGSYNHP